MASVRLQGITKQYEDNLVIKGIDLDIADGEFVVLVGPSGCGKSTLLRIIAGLEDVSGGTVEIGGQVCNDIEPSRRGIAMVFQSYALYPHMTVAENMGFALKLARLPRAPPAATRRWKARCWRACWPIRACWACSTPPSSRARSACRPSCPGCRRYC